MPTPLSLRLFQRVNGSLAIDLTESVECGASRILVCQTGLERRDSGVGIPSYVANPTRYQATPKDRPIRQPINQDRQPRFAKACQGLNCMFRAIECICV